MHPVRRAHHCLRPPPPPTAAAAAARAAAAAIATASAVAVAAAAAAAAALAAAAAAAAAVARARPAAAAAAVAAVAAAAAAPAAAPAGAARRRLVQVVSRVSDGTYSALIHVTSWAAGQAVMVEFGTPTAVSGVWHATLFSSTATSAAFRLDGTAGPGFTFQIKAKGTVPERPRLRVGDPCAGAKLELLKEWGGGFAAAVTPVVWLPGQPVTVRFDGKAATGIEVTKSWHAAVTAAGGLAAGFEMDRSSDARGAFLFNANVVGLEKEKGKPKDVFAKDASQLTGAALAVHELGQEGGHTITCERLRLPPPPPAPKPPPPSSPSPPPAATLWTYSPPSPPPPPPKPAARSAAVANVHVDAPTIAFVGCDTVRLSWPFEGGAGRRVRWATCVAAKADGCDTGDGVFGGGGGDDKASKLVNAAAAVGGVAVPGLARHTEYAFRVQPQLVDGQWGAPSAATLARTSERSAPGTGPQPPRVVGAERGHAPSCTEARVRLPPARDGCDAENSFALQYRVAPADDGEWEYWGGKDAAHPPNAVLKIGGLDAASAYEFRVLGRNEDGESPWSDPSKASLAGGDAAPLDAPRATALSSASMLLEWSAPSATAACKLDLKWRVEMRRGQSSGKAGGWEQVATVAAPRAIVREGVRCGLGCSFRVTVLGIDGWNAPSEASPALTGAAPPPPSPPGAVRLLVVRAARVAAARLSGAEAEREERKGPRPSRPSASMPDGSPSPR